MRQPRLPNVVLAALSLLLFVPFAIAENIDPASDGSQYAWAENVGWMNVEPNGDGGDGIHVGDAELSGWIWSENMGWISLSCANTRSCGTVDYGVLNDGNGVLSGYAWGENIGWVNFAPSTSGVTIDPATGELHGYAWAENVGWISFNCANTSTCADVDYRVKTSWICDPLPTPPPGVPELRLDRSSADALLSWDGIPGATGSDIVHGGLNCLRSGAGNLTICTIGCLDDNRTTTSLGHADTPTAGDGFWFLVRGQNCGGSGTYESGGPSQVGSRDLEIAASGNHCP